MCVVSSVVTCSGSTPRLRTESTSTSKDSVVPTPESTRTQVSPRRTRCTLTVRSRVISGRRGNGSGMRKTPGATWLGASGTGLRASVMQAVAQLEGDLDDDVPGCDSTVLDAGTDLGDAHRLNALQGDASAGDGQLDGLFDALRRRRLELDGLADHGSPPASAYTPARTVRSPAVVRRRRGRGTGEHRWHGPHH